MNRAAELTVATEAARAAADLVMAVYAQDFAVQWKGAEDPVTDADRRANALILGRLRAAFPADAICAEESDLEDSARAAARGGRCWFVDPLDGTREFVKKSGEFCVMVGLAIAGRPVLGVVVAPVWGRTFVGVVGEGAYEVASTGQRQPLRVTAPQNQAAARAVLSRLHRNQEVDAALAGLGIQDIRQCGSAGLKFMLVATGQADLYLHTGPGPSLWDGCAPEAIALAAGAAVGDARGRRLRYDTAHLPLDRGLVVAAAPLYAHAVAALGRADSAGEFSSRAEGSSAIRTEKKDRNVEIRTPRLLLREFTDADAAAANTYEKEAAVVRYQSHPQRTLAESLEYIQRVRTDTAANSPRRLFDLAITLDGALIGRAGLHIKDPVQREAELWYVLHPAHWGKGLVREAATALMQLGFGELGVHRIVIDTDPRNHASVRIAQKLGMRQEAHFVENYFCKGEWCDSLIFALLGREWPGAASKPPSGTTKSE